MVLDRSTLGEPLGPAGGLTLTCQTASSGAARLLPGRAAETYAALGYPVLPIWPPRPDGGCTCPQGSGCPWPGKHPLGRLVPHGLRDATTDPAAVRSMWQQQPAAGVALRTGPGALDVADVDSPEGVEALRAILQSAGEPGWSGPLARTGGGGWHLAFRPTGLGNRVGLLPGVDWRGRGGLVVVWPSVHASGRRYTWARPLGPAEELPEVPPALRRLLAPPPAASQPPPGPGDPGGVRTASRYAAAALAGECARVRATSPGGRNHAVNRAAFKLGRLVAAGALTEASVTAALTDAAAAAGLGRIEAGHAIRSGLAAGQDPARHRALARQAQHANPPRTRRAQGRGVR
ncbi:MAG TPA: bifunctional DNA primase/polymerase [Streptosporangiaceae bacterium]